MTGFHVVTVEPDIGVVIVIGKDIPKETFFCTITLFESTPFTYKVCVPNPGFDISDPPSAQFAVEVEIKLSYE